MVYFPSLLKITNARISDEPGAPRKRGARLRQIGPIGLRPVLNTTTCKDKVRAVLYISIRVTSL
jgi:hypothetical protein